MYRGTIKQWRAYETLQDIEVVSIVCFGAPYVGVYKKILPSEETFVINKLSNKHSKTSCIPMNYRDLEDTFVPKSDILNSDVLSKEYKDILFKKRYLGYFLIIPFDTIERFSKMVMEKVKLGYLPFPDFGIFIPFAYFLEKGMPEGLIKTVLER